LSPLLFTSFVLNYEIRLTKLSTRRIFFSLSKSIFFLYIKYLIVNLTWIEFFCTIIVSSSKGATRLRRGLRNLRCMPSDRLARKTSCNTYSCKRRQLRFSCLITSFKALCLVSAYAPRSQGSLT